MSNAAMTAADQPGRRQSAVVSRWFSLLRLVHRLLRWSLAIGAVCHRLAPGAASQSPVRRAAGSTAADRRRRSLSTVDGGTAVRTSASCRVNACGAWWSFDTFAVATHRVSGQPLGASQQVRELAQGRDARRVTSGCSSRSAPFRGAACVHRARRPLSRAAGPARDGGRGVNAGARLRHRRLAPILDGLAHVYVVDPNGNLVILSYARRRRPERDLRKDHGAACCA